MAWGLAVSSTAEETTSPGSSTPPSSRPRPAAPSAAFACPWRSRCGVQTPLRVARPRDHLRLAVDFATTRLRSPSRLGARDEGGVRLPRPLSGRDERGRVGPPSGAASRGYLLEVGVRLPHPLFGCDERGPVRPPSDAPSRGHRVAHDEAWSAGGVARGSAPDARRCPTSPPCPTPADPCPTRAPAPAPARARRSSWSPTRARSARGRDGARGTSRAVESRRSRRPTVPAAPTRRCSSVACSRSKRSGRRGGALSAP